MTMTNDLFKKFKDISGEKFNHLTAVKLDQDRILETKSQGKNNVAYWLCSCDCGNPKLFSVALGALTTGNTKSCGCIHTLGNLIGRRFHKLTVKDYAYTNGTHKYWHCECDCGNKTVAKGTSLNTGRTKSCGCFNAESKTTHGLSSHPLYKVFYTMKQRCFNPNSDDYHLYGHKNIGICKEWLDDFVTFYDWAVASGYESGLEIDRIDSNKGYCPENCRWVNDISQANNTSRNINITIDGTTKTFMEWCRYYGKNHKAVYARLQRGWDVIEAFTTETDGSAHFNKSRLLELNGKYKTLLEWCRIYNKRYATIHRRISSGWDLNVALNTPTDGKKHKYVKNNIV